MKGFRDCLFALFLAFLPLNQALQEDTLKGLILLVTRGHTAIKSSYPNDLYLDQAYWPDGFGQLTIDGKNQLFTLGRLIADRYSSFIPENPHQILVKSLDDNSCLESALTVSAGAFPPRGRWDWNEKLSWQPIPVHSVSPDTDEALGIKACPALEGKLKAIGSSDSVTSLFSQHEKLISLLQDQTGFNEINISTIIDIHQALETELAASLTLPSWLNDSLMNDLRRVSVDLQYLINAQQLTQKVVAGPLFQLIAPFVSSIANNGDAKLFLLTTKQAKLLSFLATAKANLTSQIYPSFGSSIAVEIYQSPTKGMYFNLLYNDNPESSTWQPLFLQGCQELFDCQLDQLLRLTQEFRSDTQKLCLATGSSDERADAGATSDNLIKSSSAKPLQRHQVDSVDVFMGAENVPAGYAKSSAPGWNIFMIVVLCIAACIIVLLSVKMIFNRQPTRRRNDYDYL